MRHIRNTKGWSAAAMLLPLLAGALLLAGCESDPVAPQDDPPALSAGDVANQAGWVATAAQMIAPQAVEFAGKGDKDVYTETFTGDVNGTITLDFSAGGAPAAWDVADYVEITTPEGAPLIISVGIEGVEGTILLGLDLMADIDRTADPDEATVGGGGTMVSGPYAASFTFESLVVVAGGYPASGTMTFLSGGFTATVTFDGDNTATIAIAGGPSFSVNLDTGATSELQT